MNDIKTIGVDLVLDTSEIDILTEKANQLKSLLQEVKELAASLNVSVSLNGKPTSIR